MEEDQPVTEVIYQGTYNYFDDYGTLIGLIISIIIAVIFYKKAKFDYHTKLSISICLFVLIFTSTSSPSMSTLSVFILPFIGFGMYLDLRQKENEKK